jgi:hypothetical protein
VQTPSDLPDDIVMTPTSAPPRKGSVALEDDPEVRRDFEARIAAATAALQRHPSISAPAAKLERKNTKRGAMTISSPKLVSSSSSISGTLLSPQGSPHDGTKAERSGPTHKISLKWKKAFRKGPSITNAEVFSPPPSASSSSPLATLDEPISLGAERTPRADLQGFKFPPASAAEPEQAPYGLPSPPGTANPTSGLRQMIGKIRRGKSDEAAQVLASASTSRSTSGADPTPKSLHTPTASDDSAVAKFIAAGRALGLNNEQLNEMIAAKGLAGAQATTVMDRTGTTTSLRSNGSAALTGDSSAISRASPSPVTPGLAVHAHALVPPVMEAEADEVRGPQHEAVFDKREGLAGLVRALSQSKKKAPPIKVTPSDAELGAPGAAMERRKIVRRTLLLPDHESDFGSAGALHSPRSPRSPMSFSTTHSGQPGSPAHVGGRKNSIRRKPIALSKEDERLVVTTGSPVANARVRTTSEASEVHAQGMNVGLGFLAPDAPGESRRPSADSSRSETSGVASEYGERGIEIT